MTFPITYCSVTDVESILSAEGVSFASDDDRSGIITADEIDFLNDVLQWTQSKINYYLVQWYDLATIPGNTWIKWCHACFAACQLMRRRGNSVPDGLILQEAQYLEWLEQVRTNRALIPPDGDSDAKLLKSGAGMTMSNQVVDSRFRRAKIRYVPQISTGPQGSPSGIPRYPDHASVYTPY